MPPLKVYNMGSNGVNVDKNPTELDDNELRQAQNAIRVEGTGAGIRKRPGLVEFNTDPAAGAVSGGITVPLIDMFSGNSILYMGRGGEVV